MKAQLDQEDIQAIAGAVMELVSPLIAGNGRREPEDVVFDKRGLSEYLKLSSSTINKMVSNRRIPHFKIRAGQSGGVRFFKRDIDKWIGRQTIPETGLFKDRR